jgi:hypothetical protein
VVKSWDWDQYCRAVFTIIKTYRHSLQGRWHLAFEKNCINLKCYLSFQENTSFSAHWYLRNLYHHILQTCFLLCAVSFSSKIITQHRSIHGFLSFFLSKGIKKKKTNIKPEYLTAESICLQVLFLSVAKSLLSVIVALEV